MIIFKTNGDEVTLKNTHEILKEKIDAIPLKPGIYQMKDKEGNIIYVGKSKTLKSRVKSYFYGEHEREKTKMMVFNIHDIDYIVTDTHLEAQILECALIKKLQPIYNKQFKNDKRYMYLKIESYNRFKPVSAVYEKENDYCLGPYRSKNILFDTVKFFENIYPILKYDNSYDFTYKILPEKMNEDTFEKNRECLIDIFNNKENMEAFLSKLQNDMGKLASELKFEAATMYRDMIDNIRYLYNNTNQLQEAENRKILLGEKIDDGYKVFYISDDRIILKKKYEKLTEKSLKDFLKKSKEMEVKSSYIIDEKRNLDFKKIIQNEIKDTESKSILFVDRNYELSEFINSLNFY